MASEHWFRWHHGTVTDPKWRVVASRCVTSVTVGHVVAVWAAMMENASMASPRGSLSGWDDEDVAAGLGFTAEQVSQIRQAMQGKTLTAEELTAWEKRQPKREDSSTARMRELRDRKRSQRDASSAGVTQGDAQKRAVTPETETETEEEHICGSTKVDPPADRSEPIPFQAIVDAYNSTMTGLPKVRELTTKRRTLVRSAWQASAKRRSMEFWRAYFAECQDDGFLNGTGPYREPHANWRPDFDYLLSAKVVTRVYEQAMDRIERGSE